MIAIEFDDTDQDTILRIQGASPVLGDLLVDLASDDLRENAQARLWNEYKIKAVKLAQ